MFDWLRRLFQPVASGTLMTFIKRKTAPPTPSPEEFVSPLREELKAQLAIKPDIGYNDNCACCRAQRTIDTKIATAIADKEDPQPWLQEVHTELVSTQDELKRTQTALVTARRDAEQWKNPLNRIRWLAAGGTVGILFLVAKEVFQAYVLPLILSSIP